MSCAYKSMHWYLEPEVAVPFWNEYAAAKSTPLLSKHEAHTLAWDLFLPLRDPRLAKSSTTYNQICKNERASKCST